MKNLLKVAQKDFSQQIQEVCDTQVIIQTTIKDNAKKLQSARDSQINANTEIRKQLQRLTANKQTCHSGSQTDDIHSTTFSRQDSQPDSQTKNIQKENSPKDEYSIVISNRYTALSDDTDDHSTSSPVKTPQSTMRKNTQNHTNTTPKQTNKQSDKQPKKQNTLHPFHLRPPTPTTTGLLCGDSNLRSVHRNRLDYSGATEIRTLPTATVDEMTAALQEWDKLPQIKRVVLHVGTNDVKTNTTLSTVIESYQNLLQKAKTVFPFAKIALTAVLPQKRGPTKLIQDVNDALKKLCANQRITFLLEDKLQNLSTPKQYIQSDGIHLTTKGLSIFLRKIKRFLVENDSTRQTEPKKEKQPIPILITNRPDVKNITKTEFPTLSEAYPKKDSTNRWPFAPSKQQHPEVSDIHNQTKQKQTNNDSSATAAMQEDIGNSVHNSYSNTPPIMQPNTRKPGHLAYNQENPSTFDMYSHHAFPPFSRPFPYPHPPSWNYPSFSLPFSYYLWKSMFPHPPSSSFPYPVR